MIPPWQIPRHCLGWLLLAQLMLLLVHVRQLPWWLLLLFVACGFWRIMIFSGRWNYPAAALRALIALLSAVAIALYYARQFSLDAMVSLLLCGFSLKLLEAQTRRDIYLLMFLGYFVALTALLFDQSLLISAYILLTVLVLTTALLALHQAPRERLALVGLRSTAGLFIQAAPLMVVLFVIAPRLPPLWSVPLPSSQARTGVADELAPGDISSLAKSDKLAFRVSFGAAIPPPAQRYWRGVVMSEFDGERWRQAPSAKPLRDSVHVSTLRAYEGPRLDYQVIQEPSQRAWLYSLAPSYSDDGAIRHSPDYRLEYNRPLYERIRYRAQQLPALLLDVELDNEQFLRNTRLPSRGNPRARALAQQLLAAAGGDPRAYIDAVLARFAREPFYYSLQPPLLRGDRVDAFLFESRRGFCGHYASSFVFLMRAAGLPARIVAGYMGGEYNPISNSLSVYEFDAHAWAEVWLPGEGWRRVDPTAAVAPQRVENSLRDALAEEGSFLADSPLAAMRHSRAQWLTRLRLRWDALSYQWARWVLQYDQQRQSQILLRLLGEISPQRIVTLLLAVGALVFLLVALDSFQWLRRSRRDPLLSDYERLCALLARAGFARRPSEAPLHYAERVERSLPALDGALIDATRTFVSLSYKSLSPAQRRLGLRHWRRQLRRLRGLLSSRSNFPVKRPRER